MVVYVCYTSYRYEGCSPPEAVFLKEIDAEEYCAKQNHIFTATTEYKELEINE